MAVRHWWGSLLAVLGMMAAGCHSDAPAPSALERLDHNAHKVRAEGFSANLTRIRKAATDDAPDTASFVFSWKPLPEDSIAGGLFYASGKDQWNDWEMWYLADSLVFVNHKQKSVRVALPEEAEDYLLRFPFRRLRVYWEGIDTAKLREDSVEWQATASAVILRHPDQPGKEGIKNLTDSFYVDDEGMWKAFARHYDWLFMHAFTRLRVDTFHPAAADLPAIHYPDSYTVERPHIEAETAEAADEAEVPDWVVQSRALEGQPAPDFVLRWLSGDSARLSEFQGKPVILDFWYIGCYWCSKVAPTLVRFYEEYHDKGLEVIGVNPYDEADEMQKYHEYMALPYPVARIGEDVPKQYHVMGYPTMVMVDRSGKVFRVHIGYADSLYERLVPVIDTLLGPVN